MKTLILYQCLVCRKIFSYKWVYNINIIDIVIEDGVEFGITISHGYCNECYKKWQGDFEKDKGG